MSNDDRLDEKLNPNPLPGISHDFYCTHEAVLCACWAAKVEALLEENERLRAALQALYDALAVGQSVQVRHRIREHLKKDKPNVTRWAVMSVPAHVSVNEAERDLIKRFAPSMNKVHNPQWVR